MSKFPSHLTEIKALLTEQCNTFQAGRVAKSLEKWKSVTSDKDILTTVLGTKIEFSEFPEQNALPQTIFNKGEKSNIKEEIQKLALKRVVEAATYENDKIISNVFWGKKADGSHRLNLKDFNSFVKYQKFKMDALNTILNLMSEHCFMASERRSLLHSSC